MLRFLKHKDSKKYYNTIEVIINNALILTLIKVVSPSANKKGKGKTFFRIKTQTLPLTKEVAFFLDKRENIKVSFT